MEAMDVVVTGTAPVSTPVVCASQPPAMNEEHVCDSARAMKIRTRDPVPMCRVRLPAAASGALIEAI